MAFVFGKPYSVIQAFACLLLYVSVEEPLNILGSVLSVCMYVCNLEKAQK